MTDKVILFELDIDIEALIDNSGKVFRELDGLRIRKKASTVLGIKCKYPQNSVLV